MISNIKQELSHIKHDVEKLMVGDETDYKIGFNPEHFSPSLKHELAHHKEIEEQLKKEIKGLRSKEKDDKSN